jgi:hypothetical protein
MTKIAIPPDLAAMFAACEDAYEQATREGYAENPAVIAAVTALKSAWKTLHLENYKRMTAKGFFPWSLPLCVLIEHVRQLARHVSNSMRQ